MRPDHDGPADNTPPGRDSLGYSIRVSDRARRVRLVMSLERGLEVVVPRRFDRRRIPALVEGRRTWVERATARIEEKRRRLREEPPRLPDRIVLPGVGEEWEVEYRPGTAPGARETPVAMARERPGRRVAVTGDIGNPAACRDALGRWLCRKARKELVPRLSELARLHGFDYGRVAVRQQRTRWASCSRGRTISLNARLLFVPPEVVDHVLLHELCHTRDMDHSARFWARLEACDPDHRTHRKQLRAAGAALPTWLDHDIGESQL